MQLAFGIIPAHGPTYLSETLEQVRLAQEYGFDSIWIEEHHDAGPYWPTPMLAIAALAPHLGSLSIGTAILVLPLHDPVHLAEQSAVLDILTHGRLVLGFGLGDDAEEFASFSVPTGPRGPRAEEQIAIMRALWSGETLTFHGEHYNLEGVRLKTSPYRPGGPPVWIGGWGKPQLRRAANVGDAWLPGPVGTFSEIRERQEIYDEHVREQGEDPLKRLRPLIRDVIVAESDEEAWKLASDTVLPSYYKAYVESEHVLVGKETSGIQITDLHDLAEDRLVVGNPAAVTSQLIQCVQALACTHLVMRLKQPGLNSARITEMLHLLGRNVLPELQKATL